MYNHTQYIVTLQGFFKRTVRKELTYTCREDKQCLMDKRQRTRCQFCRYNKCMAMGMKREAVQLERQRGSKGDKNGGDDEMVSSSLGPEDMPAERILEAERICERLEREQLTNEGEDIQAQLRFAAKKQLTSLVEWAKHIPHFTELCLDDQVSVYCAMCILFNVLTVRTTVLGVYCVYSTM